MKGTYRKIKAEMDTRDLFNNENINIRDGLLSVMYCCQEYYTLRCQYENLKDVQNQLPLMLPNDFSPYDELTSLDCLYIIELWRYYKKQNPDKGKSAFFDKFFDKEWENTIDNLKRMKISQEVLEDIRTTKESATLSDIDGHINLDKIAIDKKTEYLQCLQAVLEEPKKSIEESVDTLLSKKCEEQILYYLKQDNEIGYILLHSFLGGLRGQLTWANIRNEKKYFETAYCNIETYELRKAINRILAKYTLEKDQPKIMDIEQKLFQLDANESDTKHRKGKYDSEYERLQKEFYQLLKDSCQEWINEYKEQWNEIINDKNLLELKEKLKSSDVSDHML